MPYNFINPIARNFKVLSVYWNRTISLFLKISSEIALWSLLILLILISRDQNKENFPRRLFYLWQIYVENNTEWFCKHGT